MAVVLIMRSISLFVYRWRPLPQTRSFDWFYFCCVFWWWSPCSLVIVTIFITIYLQRHESRWNIEIRILRSLHYIEREHMRFCCPFLDISCGWPLWWRASRPMDSRHLCPCFLCFLWDFVSRKRVNIRYLWCDCIIRMDIPISNIRCGYWWVLQFGDFLVHFIGWFYLLYIGYLRNPMRMIFLWTKDHDLIWMYRLLMSFRTVWSVAFL